MGKTAQLILRLLRQEPGAIREDLAEAAGVTVSAVEKQIASLKKRGLLKRIGPAKGGHWQVNAHFRTTDDLVLRKLKSYNRICVLNPVEFVCEVDK